jgi:hypothetical protein
MTEEKEAILSSSSAVFLSLVDKCHSQLYYVYTAITHSIQSFIHSFFFWFFFLFILSYCFLYCYRIKGRTLPGVYIYMCVYLLIRRNRHVDEMNSIQYNRIDTQCA